MARCTARHEHVRNCFRQAYDFYNKHKNAATTAEWAAIAKEAASHGDLFIIDMLHAVVRELERGNKEE